MKILHSNEEKISSNCNFDDDTLSPLLTTFCAKLILYKINSLDIREEDKYALVKKMATISNFQ